MMLDTPPRSPEIKDLYSSDDDMLLDEDVFEVIDLDEVNDIELAECNDNSPTEHLEEETFSLNEDATCIFRGHEQGHSVFCCSLSKNGKLAATGSEDDKAYVWDTATGEIILECTGHKDSVIFADFSFNEMYLVTGDMSGTIKLWQISDKTCIWETSLNDITWMKWHFSAMVLLVGLATGEIYLLKVPEDNIKIFMQGYGDRTETGIILPDGKRAAIGYNSGTIRVIDLKTDTVISTMGCDPTRLHGHSSTVTALDCYLDNNLLISASLEGKTILSSANNGKLISILQDFNFNKAENSMNDDVNYEKSVEVAAFCKDPTFPVAATGTIENFRTNGKLYIWDISKQTLRHEIEQETGITRLVWTRTSILFTAALDGTLRCFDAKPGHFLKLFSGHKATILDLYISYDEKKVLTASDDSTARIFDIS